MKKSEERCVRRWQMTPRPLTPAGDIQSRVYDMGSHFSNPPHFREWVFRSRGCGCRWVMFALVWMT